MPLAVAVLSMGPSQAASSGSHGGIKGGLSSNERWRESIPCICHWPVRTIIHCLLVALWSARFY